MGGDDTTATARVAAGGGCCASWMSADGGGRRDVRDDGDEGATRARERIGRKTLDNIVM